MSYLPSHAGLYDLLLRRGGVVDRNMLYRAGRVSGSAKGIAPVVTGEYRSNIGVVPDGLLGYQVRAMAPHSMFVEEDTEPHDIVAKNGGVLRFMVAGATVFAARVHHPGTTGQHVLARALPEALTPTGPLV